MDEFQLRNKIHEVKSYIASDWPGIEERKHLYQKLSHLEKMLKNLKDLKRPGENKDQEGDV